MPKSVPLQALQVELSSLNKASIVTLADLSNLSAQELEGIVRPATARTLLQHLSNLSPASASSRSPTLSPHVSRDMNSPVLFRNRLKLHIGTKGRDSILCAERSDEEEKSPRVKPEKRFSFHINPEDHDMLLTLSVLQNLMPFADRQSLQQDLDKLTKAGIVHLDQISEYSSAELATIVGSSTAALLETYSQSDSAHSVPFLSISPQNSVTTPLRSLSLNQLEDDSLPRRGLSRMNFNKTLLASWPQNRATDAI